ncbi:hypothetical protein D5086_001571 [Populus alba]|uniref:Uncharacterized protein n=1 Tax=Populus alba TaxID=43335 RepID=A0ACC4D1D2_POPAL
MERVKAQEEHEEQSNQNWSETVEDLVTAGDSEGAITLLETEVSRLETLNPSEAANLQLVSALTELAKLYSSKHFSLKSDELLSRASLIKQRTSGDVESVEKEDEISKCNAVSNDDGECFHKGDLAGTVGPYDRNVFLCFKNPDAWLPHVEEDDLPKVVSTALKTRKDDITVKEAQL